MGQVSGPNLNGTGLSSLWKPCCMSHHEGILTWTWHYLDHSKPKGSQKYWTYVPILLNKGLNSPSAVCRLKKTIQTCFGESGWVLIKELALRQNLDDQMQWKRKKVNTIGRPKTKNWSFLIVWAMSSPSSLLSQFLSRRKSSLLPHTP